MRYKLLKNIKNNHPKKLSTTEIKTCFKIIQAMSQEPQQGHVIAKKVGIDNITLKKHIMFIRREMVTKFQNPTGKIFLVANKKGYWLTDDTQALMTYLDTLQNRYKNIKSQILELKLALLNNDDV